MKYIFFILLIFICFFGFSSPIHFFSGSYSELREEARRSQKYIFIDFYADWCRPCLMMQSTTFVDDTLGDFVNLHLLAFKVNCDKDSLLAKEFHVPNLPYWVIMSPEGEVKYSYNGFADADFVLFYAKQVLNFSEQKYYYQQHPNDVDALQDYAASLVKYYPDSAEHVVEQFLYKVAPEKWVIYPYWNVTNLYIFHVESPVFQYITKNAFVCKKEQEQVSDYIDEVLVKTHARVFKNKDRNLLETYKEAYTTAMMQLKRWSFAPEACKGEIELDFLALEKNELAFINLAKRLLTEHFLSISDKYADFSILAAKTFKSAETLTLADTWAKKSTELDNMSSKAFYAQSYIRFRKGDLSNAMRFADKAKLLALTPAEKGAAEDLIQKIQNRSK